MMVMMTHGSAYFRLGRTRLAWCAVLACASFACADGSGPDDTKRPASMAPAASVAVAATVATPTAVAPAVVVKNSAGEAIAGVSVSFNVTGGGTVERSNAITDASGTASAGTWVMGELVGVNTVTATIAGLTPVSFVVRSLADTVVSITPLISNPTTALTGVVITPRPGVHLEDRFGNNVEGQLVEFEQSAGGGVLLGSTAFSDTQGNARVGNWTMPLAEGTHTLRATARSVSTTLSITATTPPSEFNIDVRYAGTMTTSQRTAFENAAARWRHVITGDLSNVTFTSSNGIDANSCHGVTHPAVRETVDDLLIFVEVKPLDGPRGLLGQAGPCVLRTTNNLPVIGIMQFDEADMAIMEENGSLQKVIMHEMGHVIGFGTVWTNVQPPVITGAGGADPFFSGVQAKDYFGRAGGITQNGVPVENCATGVPTDCGQGTRDAHWRESMFQFELMTGYINSGTTSLSAVTVASLADVGYAVNIAAADAYQIPIVSGFALQDMTQLVPIREKLVTARFIR